MDHEPFPEPAASWVLAARADEVSKTRHAVLAYVSEHAALARPLGDVSLSLAEALANAVVHAYRDTGEGEIRVAVSLDSGRSVLVSVSDDGPGPSPRSDTPGLGLGLPLIASLTDEFELRADSSGHGTEVLMVFACVDGGSGSA